MTPRTLTLVLGLIATGAVAHEKVTSKVILARMDLMIEIRDSAAVLGAMAKGTIPHDAAAADRARAALVANAAKIPAAFRAPDMDPNSEASPRIWDNFADFSAEAAALEAAAGTMKTGSAREIGLGMREVGKTCGSCHQDYRQ
ncbi:cytochrome c-554 [Primorskyibacter flagellatus]|uniref:Cytochrome c-554 n=1 Tax=Primorskyibacter flagellatus TaxID=1387277 RepID=A0A917AC79_9RHOB|nr:cytochrome c [Primorskyibacter flagellatus]GGE42748.1 cytochrome c-554 [Primorskyibacter flagellatus]